MIKACNTCNKEKPFTSEYFSINKRIKSGLNGQCKVCKSKYLKKWYSNNKEHVSEYMKKWMEENYEHHQLNVKKYRYKVKGVYGLFENGVCLYIGESTQLFGRLVSHRSCIKNPDSALSMNENRYLFYKQLSKHKHIISGILEETDNHVEREQYYINKYKPLYNEK